MTTKGSVGFTAAPLSPAELSETVAHLRRIGGCGAPILMIAALASDPRLSFASMSDCMAVGISGGCGLACPVLHAGRCETAEDFRAEALQVCDALKASPLEGEGQQNQEVSLSQSHPSRDAQERTPGSPHSGGGREP